VQIDEQAWIFSNPATCSILLETQLPLTNIQLQLENHSMQGTLNLEIAAFDEESSQRQLPAAGVTKIDLQQPPYKKIKNRYFYQLYLRGKVSAGTSVPAWLFRVNFH
jgi:hypothetical protein